MSRFILGLMIIVGSAASADPAERAFSFKFQFGGPSSAERGVEFDLFQIGEAVQRAQENSLEKSEIPIVLDGRHLKFDVDETQDEETRALRASDPNLVAGETVTIGAETLRGELRPISANELFGNRIRATGTATTNRGPANPNTTPVFRNANR